MASRMVRKRSRNKRRREAVAADIHWSDKQIQALDWFNTDERYLLLDGSVRSGKTFVGSSGFYKWAYDNFADQEFILSAITLKQMSNVILKELNAFCRNNGVQKRAGEGGTIIMQSARGENTFIPCVGYDAKAMDKILGITAAGALCDEGIKMNKGFVDELGFRCSVDGAKLVLTNNPDNPNHWYKREYIDKIDSLDGTHMRFQLSDNPTNTQKYINQLHRQYTGATLRRKVFGEWAADTGLIYPGVVARPLPNEAAGAYMVPIDVGSATSTHAILVGKFPSGLWAVDEWVHNGKEDGQLSDYKQVTDMLDRWHDISIAGYIIDPAANSFQLQLQEQQTQPVIHAINDVIPGIEITRTMLARGMFNISPNCPILLQQVGNYVWDENASERGEDKPVKNDDHGPDAMRYFNYTYTLYAGQESGGVFIGGRYGPN